MVEHDTCSYEVHPNDNHANVCSPQDEHVVSCSALFGEDHVHDVLELLELGLDHIACVHADRAKYHHDNLHDHAEHEVDGGQPRLDFPVHVCKKTGNY